MKRSLLKNYYENAYEALRANRLRTGLTIIGITVGIASITIVLSLLGGVGSFVKQQTGSVDGRLALVRSGSQPAADILTADTSGLTPAHTLTEQDAIKLSQIPGAAAAPMSIIKTNLKANDTIIRADAATMLGTSPSFKDIAGLQLKNGQFIDDAGGAVIGEQLSVDLFGTENAIGNVFHVRGEPITVVGTLKRQNQPVNPFGVDLDRTVIVPLAVARQFTQRTPQIQQIALATPDNKGLQTVLPKARDTLKELHRDDYDYHILTGEQITAPQSRLMSAVATTMTVIAGVSLLMGGVGIMNIMLVNVAERQREVAIRKAVGATHGQIVTQFLIEAGIIGLFGGIIGYILGLAGTYLLSLSLPFSPVIHWQTALLAVGMALGIGILFGIYPAIRAAHKDLTDTLRT